MRHISFLYSLRVFGIFMLLLSSLLLLYVFMSPELKSQDQVKLLDVSGGQLPNDTGQDDKTLLSIIDYPELGGKALEVVYAPGDSFGNSRAGESNWSNFLSFEFDAFNPGSSPVQLTFVIRHNGSVDYGTRVNIPINLSLGRNSFSFNINDLRNSNGSKPDLSSVSHWYLATGSNDAPTLYFTDFILNRSTVPAIQQSSGRLSGLLPGTIRLEGRYTIKGTIGGEDVDLVFEAEGGTLTRASSSANDIKSYSDPLRIARLRAATMPTFNEPILFNTPEADAIVSALEIYPEDNAFNQVISTWPVHENSANIIAANGPNNPMRYNADMAYVLVPPGQARVDMSIGAYANESDPGPFPIPNNLPIENWPVQFQDEINNAGLTLKDVQENGEGDRHAIVVDPVNRFLYEFANVKLINNQWTGSQASIFDLSSNSLRRNGWTSADAAGLPIFPAVVRYDELMRGEIEHALRVTVPKTRRSYISPATHYASRSDDVNLPRMGERLRLRADFDISGFSPEVKTILRALQKYGMFVADNGIAWAISVTPDSRIPDMHEEFRKVKGSDFEVVTARN